MAPSTSPPHATSPNETNRINNMTELQTWLTDIKCRLTAAHKEPAQEDRDREAESLAWSELYRHAPTDLARATAALQAVLDLHHETRSGYCDVCVSTPGGGNVFDVQWPCPTVKAAEAAITDQQ